MANEFEPAENEKTPRTASSDDPATAAFEALRAEVALVRRAVAGLAAERANATPPDYSETLGNILQAGIAAARRLKTLAEQPVLQLTPDVMAQQITAAAETTRRADHLALKETSALLQSTMHDIKAALCSARLAKLQRIWLAATGGICFVTGMVLWAVVAGLSDRTPPIDHQSPEAKAAAILGMDESTAGEHLIQTASPNLWQDIVLGDRIVITNRKILEICRRKASKQPVRCVIQVPADQP